MTVLINLEQAGILTPAALNLLRICSFFHPTGVPMELAQAALDLLGDKPGHAFRPALELPTELTRLARLALVRLNLPDGTFCVHRLTQEAVRQSMSCEGQRYWRTRAVAVLARSFPTVCPRHWLVIERLLPHALGVLRASRGCASETRQALLRKTGFYLIERGRYAEALALGYDQVHDDLANNC